MQQPRFWHTNKSTTTVQHLFSEEGRFVGPVSGCVACAPHGFHMRDRHAQDGQLVRFPGQSAAGRDHV